MRRRRGTFSRLSAQGDRPIRISAEEVKLAEEKLAPLAKVFESQTCAGCGRFTRADVAREQHAWNCPQLKASGQ